jgi:predicted permease
MSIRHVLGDVSRDLRYGARVLIRNPLFSLVAVVSLALGIGGAASVFTVLNAVILRDLPVPNPEQLYYAQKAAPGREFLYYSWPAFDQVRSDLHGRAEVTAYTNPSGMQVRPDATSKAPADRGLVQLVSGEFFQVFRQQPQIGRLLQPDDNRQVGAHPVAVISDAFWERHFARSPAVIGREMVINGTNFAIIGVSAREFFGPILAVRNPDVWVPLMMQPVLRYSANASSSTPADLRQPWPPQDLIEWLHVFVRAPQQDAAAVAAIMTTQYQREGTQRLDAADQEGPARVAQQKVLLEAASRGTSRLRNDLTTPLYVLLGMVGVLLIIASGNLASLLISRANAREREMAIRLSIGAGRARIVRQLLAETLLLASVGGVLGLLLAAWGRDALLAMFATGAVIDLNTGFDWRVLAFCVVTTLAAGLLAGVGPALRTTRVSLADSMKAQARSVGSTARGALVGKSLVTAQIAFCLLLLVLAALFTRSMQSLMKVDVGYDRSAVLLARLDVRSIGLPSDRRQALYDRIIERVQAVPGVESASLSMMGPFGTGQRTSSLSVEGYTPKPNERMVTNEENVTDRYFETVGLKILEGRGFTSADRRPDAQNTIINQTMANKFFPDGGAVGRRWNYGDTIDAESPQIIGVVQDARYNDLRGTTPYMVYRLAATRPDEVLSSLEVHTAMHPTQLIPAVRKALTEVESGLPVFDMISLDDRLDRGASNERLVANLTTAFSAVALLLACLGLYGTISYGVTRRVTELGVRMALGAARRDVLLLVIREAAVLVVIGALIGVPLAILASRGVKSLLYGVGSSDPLSYIVAAGALIAVSAFAAFLPAHRASRIDPMVALRKD